MSGMSRRQVMAATVLAPLFTPQILRAAAYPDRPIRIVIPYTAGGLAETIMRMFAVSMEQRLGQKLVIEAKPGAAGNIGTQEVSRAEPDGYTIVIAATNNFVINQFLLKMSFDRCAAGAVLKSGSASAHARRVHRLCTRQSRQAQLRNSKPWNCKPSSNGTAEANHRRGHHGHSVPGFA